MDRRLTTIVAADLVGYSRLMAADEEGVIGRLRAARAEVIDPTVAEAGGRIIKTMGDGLLIEFPSPVAAMRCVIAVQEEIAERETGPEDQRLRFRVGINLGDIVEEGDDILGDGVNVAARLEQLSAPGGAVISRAVHDQLRGKVDAELTAMGPQKVKNIPEPIDAWRVEIEGAEPAPMSYDLPEKPSIIVLPFANMSPDPDQEFFCDGLVEDVTTALSRFRQLFVIARNTAFTFKGKSVDVREVSRALGVRYVLEGSVRSAGRRLRVTAQLIDAVSDRHIWAEKYDGDAEDVFEFQDELTGSIVASVAPEVNAVEIERAKRAPATDLSVWSLNARARAELIEMTPESLIRCREFVEQALALDPRNSESHALIAESHSIEALYAWNRPPAETLPLIMDAAEKAVALDRKNESALVSLAFGLILMRRHSQAISMSRRALELNPNSSDAMSVLGIVLIWDRQPEEGVRFVREALRLSPRDWRACYNRVHVGVATFYARDFEATVAHCEEAHREFPQNPTPLRLMAAALGWLDRTEEARAALTALEKLVPGVTVASSRIAVIAAYEEDVELFLEGLRRSGMPE